MTAKKSKYRHAVINKKRYYFYSIRWLDITGDAGHATPEEFDKFECAVMITQAYVYKRTNKFLWTFASNEAYKNGWNEIYLNRVLRKEVDIGANGTQGYMIKHGKNKGTIL